MPTLKTILLVDNQPLSLKATSLVLERAGYIVVQAGTESEALEKIRLVRPSIVLLDVVSPDMSGSEVLRQIRAQPSLAGLPVVLLRAQVTSGEQQAAALDAGADGYIARPVANAELVARVGLHLRQREITDRLRDGEQQWIAGQAVAKLGSWELDFVTLNVVWSAETYRIFEVEESAITIQQTHQRFLDLVHPEDRSAVDEAFLQSIGRRDPGAMEHRLLMPDGRIKHVEARWKIFYDDAGRPLRAVGTSQDITERKRAERRAADTQLLNQALIDTSPMAIITYRFSGEAVAANVASATVLGAPGISAVQSQNFRTSELWKRTGLLALADEVFETGRLGEIDIRGTNSFGKEIWLHCRLTSFAYGGERYLLGFFDDIRERKEAEEALLRNEMLLRMATRVSRLGAWSLNLSAQVVTWSAEVCEIHEVPVGHQPTMAEAINYYAAGSREVVTEAFTRCVEDGAPFDVEVQIVTAKGRRTWVRAIGEAGYGETGEVTHVQGAFQDINDRKTAEDERRELEARLGITLENLSDGFLTVDAEWRITYVNLEAERMFRRKRPDVIGQPLWATVSADVGSLIHTELERVRREGAAVQFETHYAPFDTWFDVRAFPAVHGLAIYVRDIGHQRKALAAERASEERFRLLAKATNDAIWDWDLATNTLWWNEGFERLFGYRRDEVDPTVESWYQGVHPEDKDQIVAGTHAAVEKGSQSWSGEYRFRRKNGEYAHVLDRGHIIRDAAGKAVRMIGGMTDLTDRKRAEEAVRASEHRYRSAAAQLEIVLNSSLDVICSFDAAGRFIQVNSTCEDVWGFRPAELLGTLYLDLVLPDDREATLACSKEVMAGWSTRDFENRVLRKDGTVSHIQWSARWSEAEQIMFCVARDNTEKQQNAARVAEQAALIDDAQDAFVVLDLQHRITFWSRGAERLYGWTASEAVGKTLNALLHVDQARFEEIDAVARDKGQWSGELEKTGKTGAVLTINSRWTLLRDHQNRPRSILVIDSDITERKKLEQQFLRAQRMESIGTLAGGIAHDLNNLLAPIVMGLSLLKQFNPRPDAQGIIDQMEGSARRGADLVKQVLSFARGVEGIRVTVQIEGIIREVETIVSSTFPKNITFQRNIAADVGQVMADPTQLNQVILNLCVNARDAMTNGGCLRISAGNVTIDDGYVATHQGVSAGRYVVVEVSDEGCGMAPETIDRAFEPFFTTKELGKGTGLGLSTVIGIVRSHGGFVNVESELGNGSTFKVYLPIERNAVVAVPTVSAPERLPRGGGELILLVDDEAAILSIARQTLETFGYRVVVAKDGAEAIVAYAQHHEQLSLVLTDIMMPVMDGAALISALGKLDPKLPIISASGLNRNGQLAEPGTAQTKYFLAKPYSAEAMLETVKIALSERE
jgi:PAS domain S-box-containing protein